ncbi:hypothetical protein FGA20_10070 [Corynebacterium diphtheriae bv. mitis]|nr:hypothetical protein FGA20_10070 [Corynebacterium diphtheriae bv. mitis]
MSRWENLRTCQGKFDQDAKDRVVHLVEDRILADYISMQEACKIVAPKLGVSWHTAKAINASPLDVKDVLLNGCLRTLW